MITISKDANKNYLAKIIKIEKIKKHPNADKLQIVMVDFQPVITDMSAKVGDLYVYFPLECQINEDYLSFTNSFRKGEMNVDKEKKGFFEEKRRVRAVKLRGEKSMGYLAPLKTVEDWSGYDLSENVGEEFDTVGEELFVNKYVVPVRGSRSCKEGKKPKISRLVDGQVHLHVETEQLSRNMYKLSPEDNISITYKYHGTSFWVTNCLVKRKLSLFEKLLKFIGVKVEETEWDYIYGSKKVVKNQYETSKKEHFYGYDLWADIKDELKESIPRGITIYGEYVGYDKNGKGIQGEYDYGCPVGTGRAYVYRITQTNNDGVVYNFSTDEIIEFCERYELNYVHLFYKGRASDLFKFSKNEHWNQNFLEGLEKKYTGKDCFICKNKVPEEGIVLRKEKMFEFEVYKLKSWDFYEYESKMLDSGNIDIESEN